MNNNELLRDADDIMTNMAVDLTDDLHKMGFTFTTEKELADFVEERTHWTLDGRCLTVFLLPEMTRICTFKFKAE